MAPLPDRRVPKTSAGTPDLTAPAPRTADGKPDLSGLWGNLCPVGKETVLCAPEVAVPQQFGDIGRAVKGGLPNQPWAADIVRARRAENGKDDPTTHCLPGGVAKLHTSALLRKIIQTPGLVVFLTERNASYRQIFTDGRPLEGDPNPANWSWGTVNRPGWAVPADAASAWAGAWLPARCKPLQAANPREIEISSTRWNGSTRMRVDSAVMKDL